MNLPIELEYEVSMNLPLHEIEELFPHHLKNPYFWKMLFKRDFPLVIVDNNFEYWYKYYAKLVETSKDVGEVELQEEWVVFLQKNIKDSYDLVKLGVILEESEEPVGCAKIMEAVDNIINYNRLINLIFHNGLYYRNHPNQYPKSNLFFTNGVISRQEKDCFYSDLAKEVENRTGILKDLLKQFQKRFRIRLDIDVAIQKILDYGDATLYENLVNMNIYESGKLYTFLQ